MKILHTRKIKVLIVDNQEENRSIIREMMSDDYEIIEASDGREAIRMLERDSKDIAVLLELMMPDMDGYEVLNYLKSHKMHYIPVLAMTKAYDEKSEVRALQCGAWDFIVKPLQTQVLKTRLRNAIARSEMSLYGKMKYMMEHDDLTGMNNRKKTFEDIRKLLLEYSEQTFMIIRIDIERFSLYNSAFGEEEGNKLICFVANFIQNGMKNIHPGVSGRMDADAFCVCVPYGNELLEQLMKSMIQSLQHYRRDYVLKPDFGVYVIEDPKERIEEMYLCAALGSRKCKSQFDTHIGFYDDKERKKEAEELWVTNEMKKALDQEQFVIYFQPKYYIKTDTACGAEALVRWQHPERGLLYPASFIPIFEKNGFISKLDYYMWEHACQYLRKWISMGIQPDAVSVNVSRISLYNPNLVELLKGLIRKYNVPVELLNLEITESAYMSNPDLMRVTIWQLRKAGFVIMMDDFGKDYSSLNTLKEIEADTLKVDISFVPVAANQEKEKIILASVIRMASWLGMKVVVEGVETEAQKCFLAAIGCDYIQGYYYAQTLPADVYERDYVYQIEKRGKTEELLVPIEEKDKKDSIILAIMQDEQVKALFLEYFQEEYQMQIIENVEGGMEFLKKNAYKIRLMIIDNTLKGFSGLDFLEYYQDDKEIAQIPKIIITEKGAVVEQIQAFNLGVYECIEKPLVREITLARLSHVMKISYQMKSFRKRGNEYKNLAEQDKMTGLLNKAAYRERCMEKLEEHKDGLHAMLVLDLDDFKSVNDIHGHLAGDQLLQCIAREIKKTFRTDDLLGRFGGDEFIILMAGIANKFNARDKAEELLKRIARESSQQMKMNIRGSIGIAFSEKHDTFETIFARADQALYEAKNNGKGRTAIYGEE